jgi:predicted O-methyltransferase YrrM
MRLIRLRKPWHWRWVRRTATAFAVVGLALVLFGWPRPGIAVFGSAILSLVLLEFAQLRRLIVEGQRQHHALVQIRPLLGELSLDFGGWAADPIMAHNIVRLLADARPSVVLECGSGSSTVMIARCLRALGRGRVISLEHDPEYASRTAESLRLHGLEDLATLVTAPLAALEVNGQMFRWYGPKYEPILQEKIDVLLVDGPPGNTGPRARYPAVPLLRPHLAPECWVMLDDADRPDERQIAHTWSRELGAKLSYLEGGRGGWLLHRTPPASGFRRAES